MLIEKILDIISKFHHYKISSYVKKLGCNTLIDVGCHKGEFLNSFLKIKIFKKFYCFEPQKEIYKNLKKKFKNNKKVKLYNHSLGENESKKKMYLSNLTSLSTMSKINQKSDWFKIKNLIVGDKNRLNKYQIVNQKKIDTVFKNISLKNSFLKIDVEGYELNVLYGAKSKIKEIPFVIVEQHTFNQYYNNFSLVNDFLLKNNFKIIKNFYYPTLHYKDVLYKNKKKGQ
jgi:FkbM family methyltransferase